MRVDKPGEVELWFFRLLQLTLISFVIKEISTGIWHVHTRDYFPWRHAPFFPLLPPIFLIAEWCVLIFGAALFYFPMRRRHAAALTAVAMLLSLSQRFSNHAALVFLLMFYIAITPRRHLQLAFKMIRYQLCIVYIFSALSKLNQQFYTGESLIALGKYGPAGLLPKEWIVGHFFQPWVALVACFVLAIEFLIPIVLFKRPVVGVALVAFFHFGLALFMPGIWTFALTMFAMSILFLLQTDDGTRRKNNGLAAIPPIVSAP